MIIYVDLARLKYLTFIMEEVATRRLPRKAAKEILPISKPYKATVAQSNLDNQCERAFGKREDGASQTPTSIASCPDRGNIRRT